MNPQIHAFVTSLELFASRPILQGACIFDILGIIIIPMKFALAMYFVLTLVK